MEFLEDAEAIKNPKFKVTKRKESKMKYNIKTGVATQVETVKVVTRNAVEFVDAVCLAGVAGFAVYTGLHNEGMWYQLLLFAGVAISLQAFLLLVKHFNKVEK